MKLKQRKGGVSPHAGRDGWGLRRGDPIRPGLVVMDLLGGGSRYEAYLAHDEMRMCLLVAKLLRPARADEPGARLVLAGEFRAIKRLDHPVIVRAFDAAIEGPRPHITLEHLEGPRLSTLLRRYGPLPLDQLLPLALQLASALHYMHRVGMVHLDVKPKNIIMSGRPRLIDLSVASTFERASALTVPTGTAGYMSPEQHHPDGPVCVGPAADSWGLGATLFEAATGALPSAAPAASGHRSRRTLLHPTLESVVTRCMADDPAARPSPAQVTFELEPLVDALPRRFPLSPPRPGAFSR